MSRDRDVRQAIADLLIATKDFDSVGVSGLPEEFGSAASDQAAAVIEPVSSTQDDHRMGMGWDAETSGGIVIVSFVTITLLYRHDDPQLRDEGVERLLNVAGNALSGQSLASLTLPALTRFTGWKWEHPTPPERRITAAFTYEYLLEGWAVYDTTT